MSELATRLRGAITNIRLDSSSEGGSTLADQWVASNGRSSAFDYMRILLAICVLLWHSYQVSYGTDAARDLWKAWPGTILVWVLPLFFSLSGFLVAGSLERSASIKKFLILRLIRIYPALCVEVILSAFVLGPLITTFSLGDYFFSIIFFKYILNMFGWIHYYLPGVFLYNKYPGIVNTSLWTVPFELECYIALPILFLFGFLKSKTATIIIFAICTFGIMTLLWGAGESGTPPGGVNGRILVLCFLAGNMFFHLRNSIPYSKYLAILSIFVGTILLRHSILVCIAPVFVAYTIAFIGLKNPKRTILVTSGDYSYGVYLYAAPIQQTVAWGLGFTNGWLLNVSIALPVTVVFALFSWHFVEKPFLKVRRYVLSAGL